jgi:hypothetical protein
MLSLFYILSCCIHIATIGFSHFHCEKKTLSERPLLARTPGTPWGSRTERTAVQVTRLRRECPHETCGPGVTRKKMVVQLQDGPPQL